MEDRKRPAIDEPRNPPSKRQATAAHVNGASAHPDADMPWKDTLEEFQKDAILRQMREYKRMATAVSQELDELKTTLAHNEKSMRFFRDKFVYIVEEAALSCQGLPDVPDRGLLDALSAFDTEPGASHKYFDEYAQRIQTAIQTISTKGLSLDGEQGEMLKELARLRTGQRAHEDDVSTLNTAKANLEKRLEDASMRYMMSEKKLDRHRSAAVQKVEASAKAPPVKQESDGDGSGKAKSSRTNGVGEADLQSLETAKQAAIAAKEKVVEQLSQMQEDHRKLTEKFTALQLKQAGLSDEDYAGTELYKMLRGQHEDVIKRANDLQATNEKLREDLKSLYSERTAYKNEADKEAQEAVMDVERQISVAEADVARLRKARDEGVAQLSIAKAAQDQERDAIKESQALTAAQAERISVLEGQVERLTAEQGAASQTAEELNSLSTEALIARITTLEGHKAAMDKEITSMGAAWQKAQTLGTKKIASLVEAEERMGKALAEKAKADQKFYATAKSRDTQMAELRQLRAQNAKTAEIMTQLKEAETNSRNLVSQLEKQLAESKDALATLTNKSRDLQQEVWASQKHAEQLSTQKNDLESRVKQKDTDSLTTLQARHKAEQQLEELQVRFDAAQKSLESWRERGAGSQGAEFDVLKGIATCAVCRHNFKSTALKTCGHVFCDQCIQERIANRARKCPNCNKAFGTGDTMRITL